MTLPTIQTGFRLVPIQQGDTLHQIALREMGDVTKWAVLIAVNNLLYPYLTGDPTAASSRVLLYGGLIKVPSSQSSSTSTPSDAYGTDIQLAQGPSGGALQLAANGDLAIVSGPANLQQALSNALNTHLGDIDLHPAYGNGAYRLLGKGSGPSALAVAAAFSKDCLEADPRVQSAGTVNAVAAGDTIKITGNAETIVGDTVPYSSGSA